MISANEKRPVQGAAEAQERLSTSSDAKYEFFQAKKKKKMAKLLLLQLPDSPLKSSYWALPLIGCIVYIRQQQHISF